MSGSRTRRLILRKAGGSDWHDNHINHALAAGAVFDLDDNSLIFAQKHQLFRIEGVRLSAAPGELPAGELCQDQDNKMLLVGQDGYFYEFDGRYCFYGPHMAFIPNDTATYERFPKAQQFSTKAAKETVEANGSLACALRLLTKEFDRLQTLQLQHELLDQTDVDNLLMLIEQVTVLRNLMILRGSQQAIPNMQLASMFGLAPSRISQIVKECTERLNLDQVIKRYSEGGQQ